MSGYLRKSLLAVAGATIGAVSANATVTYGGGGTYAVSSPINDNIDIIEGAHVALESGGSVTGVSETDFFLRGAANVRSGTLSANGNARIDAGANQYALNIFGTTVRLQDQARVTGNVYSAYYPGAQLEMSGRSVIDGDLEYAGRIRMHDQAAILGNINYNGDYELNMYGGAIAGTAHMHGINGGYAINMHGGAILGGVDAWNSYAVAMQMTGGYIGNGLLVEDWASIQGEIRGGQIDGGITIDTNGFSPTSHLILSGGQFNANAADYLLTFSDANTWSDSPYSTLEIWGGQFGYAGSGLGLYIDNLVNFDIHGRDLVYTEGWLTGYLLDGSWFSNALTFGDTWRGTFTIHNVPEPATTTLFLTAVLGVVAFRRRSRAS